MNSGDKKAVETGTGAETAAAAAGWGLGGFSEAISAKQTADSLANGDAEIKKWLLEQCAMEYQHLGIPTDEDWDWDEYLENFKVHIMEHKNDPFGIEWMKFEEDAPVPEVVRKRPHIAFKVKNFDEVVKRFKLLVPVIHPRAGFKTCFIEHKGIGIEFVAK